MKKLMILGAGIYQKPLLEYASRYYNVVLVAPAISEEYKRLSVEQYYYDIRDEENILKAAIQSKIDGIITDQTDIPVRTIAYVANRLGLPGNPYNVACIYTDKSLMRQKQIEAGISVLPNVTVSTVEEAVDWYRQLSADMIIKPLDNQGSRGVAAIRSEKELIDKFEGSKRFSSSGKVLLEKMAKGRQFAVEGFAVNGRFQSLICSDDDYFNLGDCFAAKARVFNTVAPKELKERVIAFNNRINNVFGIKQGLSHAEYIMDGDEIYLIEVGARGGGAYISSDMIERVGGLNTAEFLCKIACGDQNDEPILHPTHNTVGYFSFYLPAGRVVFVDGIEQVNQLPFVHRNTLSLISVGKTFGTAEDKTARQLIVVSADSREEWNARVDKIRSMLDIKVEDKFGNLLDPIWG